MNKFKRKSLLMILLIIIVLVVSVFSLYSAYNIRKEKNKDNNKIVDNIKDVEKKEMHMGIIRLSLKKLKNLVMQMFIIHKN